MAPNYVGFRAEHRPSRKGHSRRKDLRPPQVPQPASCRIVALWCRGFFRIFVQRVVFRPIETPLPLSPAQHFSRYSDTLLIFLRQGGTSVAYAYSGQLPGHTLASLAGKTGCLHVAQRTRGCFEWRTCQSSFGSNPPVEMHLGPVLRVGSLPAESKGGFQLDSTIVGGLMPRESSVFFFLRQTNLTRRWIA